MCGNIGRAKAEHPWNNNDHLNITATVCSFSPACRLPHFHSGFDWRQRSAVITQLQLQFSHSLVCVACLTSAGSITCVNVREKKQKKNYHIKNIDLFSLQAVLTSSIFRWCTSRRGALRGRCTRARWGAAGCEVFLKTQTVCTRARGAILPQALHFALPVTHCSTFLVSVAGIDTNLWTLSGPAFFLLAYYLPSSRVAALQFRDTRLRGQQWKMS